MRKFSFNQYLVAAGLLVSGFSGAAFASADVKPVSVKYQNVAASNGGEFPQPAYQRVVLEFAVVGTQAVGKTRQQLCPNIENDEFCLYKIFNRIAGKGADYEDAAVNAKRYQPGKSYKWELSLPAGTLKDCQKVAVWLDSKKTLGQSGAGVFNNDQATLTARRIGAVIPCGSFSTSDLEFDE